MKFGNWGFSKNRSRKFSFVKSMTKRRGTLREDPCTFMIITYFFLGWEIFQTNVVQKTKTRILYQYFLSPKIMPLMKWCGRIWQSRTAHIIRHRNDPRHRDTHSYLVLTAVTRQPGLGDSASLWPYIDITCLLLTSVQHIQFYFEWE